ncbi:MAG TPA: class I SAM-dependent methyltransferase [Actinomycetota bacterium]|nr:class I SAM-dependent methyltransferase [Actinomycetota bacterium]
MSHPPNLTYEDLHRNSAWAYGEHPDLELAGALTEVAPGPAVDLGGGQGRHALYLAWLGFDVELVDLSQEALGQARRSAAERELRLRTVCANLAFYEPEPGLQVAVAALTFHVPARHASLAAVTRIGEALNPGGMLYLSLPGFTDETRAFAADLLAAARCDGTVVRHLVTPKERPRLSVPRRNETRAVGFRT